MYRIIAALLAATSCVAAAQAQDIAAMRAAQVTTPLFTLEDAVAAAGGSAPAIEAADAGIRAAEANRRIAGFRPNPVAQAQVENVAGTGAYSGLRSSETTVGFLQTLERGGKRRARVAVASAELSRTELQAAIMAAEALAARSADIIVAGGMESMSNAPYLLPKHRGGARIGHDVVKDSMFLDGLEDAYDPGKLMGAFAEESARDYQLTREAQDAFAIESLTRANAAIAGGAFASEIVPVTTRAGEVATDEQPAKARPERIPTLKPAFAKDGTITAANASSISDGAAAMVLTRASVADAQGLAVAARLVAHAAHAHAPGLFTTAPVPAIRKVLARAGWDIADVDLFELNEAFAAVAMIAMRDLAIPHEKLNVNGGACALGHPIGASGARIMATLIAALRLRGLRRGVAALCIGGGEATAVAIELV